MPTYEYKCKKCRKRLEIFQSINSHAKRKCPECGAQGLTRLMGTGGGIIFKGSGFYQTDYRSAEYKAAEKKDKESSKKTEDKKTKKPKDKKTKEKKS